MTVRYPALAKSSASAVEESLGVAFQPTAPMQLGQRPVNSAATDSRVEGRRRDRVREHRRLGSELVQEGRRRSRVARKTQVIGTQGVDDDQDYVSAAKRRRFCVSLATRANR